MDEYLAKSKTSGDIYRLLYYGASCSRQEISQTLDISLPTTTRCLNLPGRGGRKISVAAYKLCQKFYGFN